VVNQPLYLGTCEVEQKAQKACSVSPKIPAPDIGIRRNFKHETNRWPGPPSSHQMLVSHDHHHHARPFCQPTATPPLNLAPKGPNHVMALSRLSTLHRMTALVLQYAPVRGKSLSGRDDFLSHRGKKDLAPHPVVLLVKLHPTLYPYGVSTYDKLPYLICFDTLYLSTSILPGVHPDRLFVLARSQAGWVTFLKSVNRKSGCVHVKNCPEHESTLMQVAGCCMLCMIVPLSFRGGWP
jgi:hypothetical protein